MVKSIVSRYGWSFAWVMVFGSWAAPGATHAFAPGALATAARARGFEVGAAIDHDLSAARLALAAQEFTSATPENSFKWQELSPSSGAYDFSNADVAIDWAEQNGLRIRGHTLFWVRLNGLPAWVEPEVNAAPDPAAHLTQLMETHAQTVVGRYAGRIAQWDIVNEPLEEFGPNFDPKNFFFQTLGEQYLDIAFHAAHAADPAAKLFLNETLVENLPEKLPGLISIVQGMLARGVPIHGIGLQGHFLFLPPDPATLRQQIQQIAALGLLVELTEVDIRTPLFEGAPDPLLEQAEAYRDVVGICLQFAACTGLTTWGIDDGDTWLDSFWFTQPDAPNRPLLFDDALQPKAAYDAVVTLLFAPVPVLSPIATGLLVTALMLSGMRHLRRSGRRGAA